MYTDKMLVQKDGMAHMSRSIFLNKMKTILLTTIIEDVIVTIHFKHSNI